MMTNEDNLMPWLSGSTSNNNEEESKPKERAESPDGYKVNQDRKALRIIYKEIEKSKEPHRKVRASFRTSQEFEDALLRASDRTGNSKQAIMDSILTPSLFNLDIEEYD